MDTLKSKAVQIALLALSVLLVVGVMTFAGPCVHDDGTVAACHEAAQAVLVAGAVASALSLAALFVSNGRASGVIALATACCGAFAAAAPGTLFGMCMMQTMRCWAVMRPFALACGALVCIGGLVVAVRSFRQGRGCRP